MKNVMDGIAGVMKLKIVLNCKKEIKLCLETKLLRLGLTV